VCRANRDHDDKVGAYARSSLQPWDDHAAGGKIKTYRCQLFGSKPLVLAA
jgi:hypothetical protein